MMLPKFDIVCLVHNQLHVTIRFVNHLYLYTPSTNFNLIFINNGSTDKTKEYLNDGTEKRGWTVLNLPENIGIIKGRNLGATKATSDYFINLDNDQLVGEGWINQLFEKLSKGFDVVGCEAWQLENPNTKNSVVIQNKTINKAYFPKRRCTFPDEKFTYIGCGGMLIKKTVYDKIGLFDERFSPAYFEDPDFAFRCIKSGFKLGWCCPCSINHLAHQTIENQNLFIKNEQFIKSWQEFTQKWHPYFPEQK